MGTYAFVAVDGHSAAPLIHGAPVMGQRLFSLPSARRAADVRLRLSAENNDPARYASAAIPGRIGAQVVRAFVHDKGTPIGIEQ